MCLREKQPFIFMKRRSRRRGSNSLGKNSIRSSKFVETTSLAIESNSL